MVKSLALESKSKLPLDPTHLLQSSPFSSNPGSFVILKAQQVNLRSCEIRQGCLPENNHLLFEGYLSFFFSKSKLIFTNLPYFSNTYLFR